LEPFIANLHARLGRGRTREAGTDMPRPEKCPLLDPHPEEVAERPSRRMWPRTGPHGSPGDAQHRPVTRLVCAIRYGLATTRPARAPALLTMRVNGTTTSARARGEKRSSARTS